MRSNYLYQSKRKPAWIRWFVIIASLFVLVSCEEIMNVDFDGDSTKNLVVDGAITTDTTQHQVVLSYTGDYFAISTQEMATGAIVFISDGTDIIPLSELKDGVYATAGAVAGKVGKKYTLNVILPDGREYTASDSLEACEDIDSIRQSGNYNSYMSGYGYDVLFYGHEPQPAGNHYMYELLINNELYTDTITEVNFASDEFVNGSFVRDYQVFRINEKDLKELTSLVTLEMYSISKKYYEFLSALMVETVWRGSPWDGPPANIPGNVSNGGTGFFRASAVKRKTRTFLQLPRAN
jgi:hypothetical protein